MKNLTRALLVADLSPGWEAAVQIAIGLARKLETEIVPIHVVTPPIVTVLDSGELRKALDARLREIVRATDGEDSQLRDAIINVGVPFDEVVRAADDRGASLILIGAGACSADSAIRTGVLATRVLRHSHKPVWVVKPGFGSLPRRVLCPVDMSSSSGRALRNAIRLARHLEARLTVLHVIRSLSSQHPIVAQLRDCGARDREHAEHRTQEFNEFLRDFDFADLKWRSEIRDGDPRDEIISAATTDGCDLIVMGTVGRKGLARLMVGSVTERVAQALPCSIITLKDESLIHARIGEDIEDSWELYRKGKELLEDGLVRDAVGAFELAIAANRFHSLAWEGLADAQETLGEEDRARRSRHLARKVADRLWKRMIEDEQMDR